jgi:hypothetical protein
VGRRLAGRDAEPHAGNPRMSLPQARFYP